MFLTVNMLLQEREDPHHVERVLWIHETYQICYTINIFAQHYPIQRRVADLEEAWREGALIPLEEDPWFRWVEEDALSETERATRDRAWAIIAPIVDSIHEPTIYLPAARAHYVKQLAQKFGVSERTVGNYLKRYWARGKNTAALLPDSYRCGGRGKEKRAGTKKRGRPRRHALPFEELNVTEDVKRIFQLALNKFYYTKDRASLRAAYEQMIKAYYTQAEQIDGVELPRLKLDQAIPSFTQFHYWSRKWHNAKRHVIRRQGRTDFEQNYRPVLGESTRDAMGPGSCYQIDATVGDVYLVSEMNRNWIIGRPVIYMIVDVFSRMVVGYYAGLEGPSWLGAMMALFNASEEKVSFCQRYGIEIQPEQWPVAHLPESILADRGEMIGYQADDLTRYLNIRIQNTPPYRPDWKGVIESYFHTLQTQVRPLVPGAIDVDFGKRGGHDYRLDAKLTLYEFNQILIHCILHYNQHHVLEEYQREPMMIEDEVSPLPLHLWRWGIMNRSGKLRQFSNETVMFNLLPSAQATVTYRGIKFRKLLYSSKQAMEGHWFSHARIHGSWKVDISYDPRDMSQIYLRTSPTTFEVARLLDHQERYQTHNLYDVDYLHAQENRGKALHRGHELVNKVNLLQEIEAIVDQASQMANEERVPQYKSTRLRGIRVNHQLEKAKQRQQEVWVFDQEKEKRTVQSEPAETIDIQELRLLRKKQQEGFHDHRSDS